jgi:hypothetical protein
VKNDSMPASAQEAECKHARHVIVEIGRIAAHGRRRYWTCAHGRRQISTCAHAAHGRQPVSVPANQIQNKRIRFLGNPASIAKADLQAGASEIEPRLRLSLEVVETASVHQGPAKVSAQTNQKSPDEQGCPEERRP